MTHTRSRGRALAPALVLALVPAATAALDPAAVEAWKEDLAAARAAILETHPDPARHLPATELDAAFDGLEARLPGLAPHEVVVGLAEIIAAIGDGHTRLTLPIPDGTGFVEGHSSTPPPTDPIWSVRTLPVRFGLYGEGLVVERATRAHAELAGARVVSVGGRSVAEAAEALRPAIRHDNESQLLDLLPMHFAIPEVLAARGLSPGRAAATFRFELADGRQVERTLKPLSSESTDWVRALGDLRASAPSWRHLRPGRAPVRGAFDRAYWFDRIGDGSTLFVQYNQSDDAEEGETIPEFADRLRTELASGPVTSLVLDLRWNWGGDHSRDRPLLHALIENRSRFGPGRFFVLVGRGTYSAAMMLAVELEQHVRPIFVGEPTGSSPNHFGDSRKTRLPRSGLTLRVSTLDWQRSHPGDDRDAIAPHVRVEPSWEALLAGGDPALDVALDSSPSSCPGAGALSGLLTVHHYEVPLEARLAEPAGDGPAGDLTLVEFAEDVPLRIESSAGGVDWAAVASSTPRGDLRLRARCVAGRLLGEAVFSARPDLVHPFALEPLAGR